VTLLALRGLARAPWRTAARVLVLAAAVALLGSMVIFIGHSLRTMTASAVRSVPLDWQGPVGSYQVAQRLSRGIAAQPDVLAATPVAAAPFAGTAHRAAVGEINSASGALLAVPRDYPAHVKAFRFLRGRFEPGSIVLDQQLAATLQAQPGDTISLTPRTGVKPVSFRVSGIALVTAADVLFQPLNPLSGPAPAQPPADVAILPIGTFARRVAPALPAVSAVGASGVPGAQTGVQWQVQANVDPRALGGSPSAALRRATQIRNRVERSFPGRIQFVDNLGDSLSTAAGDALYAETLYIMLAVPGALVALGLAYLAALGTVERDRRDLALLRARGASRKDVLTLAAAESSAIGLLAGALGTGVALMSVRFLVSSAGTIGLARALATFGICIALAFAGALAARVGTGLSAFRGSVVEAGRPVRRAGQPLWARLYLDILALVVSGLVYWLTARTGFSAVVNPDSNPTLSLSVYMFLAPALLWIGATLLLVRARGRILAWVARRVAGQRAQTTAGFLLASAGRRGAAINRGLVVTALLLAFGVNLGIFTATYDQQTLVDAQLSLGGDVVVDAPPGAVAKNGLVGRIAKIPGVAGTTAVDHSYAYVGPDLQDTFGIDPLTIGRGTTLRDSYFFGGSAAQMLARLRARPDGILVSRETVTDYSLAIGDLLKLRVLDRRTGAFKVAPFHVAGIVQEFPSAPRDSFMVANLTYLERLTHDPGPNVVFVKARSGPVAVSRRVAAAARSSGAVVKNIRRQTAQTVSSITTVDLAGISRIEEVFAVLLAAAAIGLFVLVAVAERRHELATMEALGASLRSVAAFVWSEASLVLGAALMLAVLLGWLLAEMLVAMLQHVFDPPPDRLALPWTFLGALAGAAVLGGIVAVALASRGLSRLRLGTILREE